jgi:hypothetical protein
MLKEFLILNAMLQSFCPSGKLRIDLLYSVAAIQCFLDLVKQIVSPRLVIPGIYIVGLTSSALFAYSRASLGLPRSTSDHALLKRMV